MYHMSVPQVFRDHKYMYLPNLKYIINNTILSKKRYTNEQIYV